MPTYEFFNLKTEETVKVFLSMSQREKFLRENPDFKQIPCAPALHSGRGKGKPDEGFRDLLKEMKKKHSKGFTKSSINTF